MKKLFSILLLLGVGLYAQVITIQEARQKNSMDSVNVEGIIFTIDYNLSSTSSGSYYIYDNTGAINFFVKGTPKAYNMGDKVRVGGHIEFFNQLTELVAKPANITVLSTGNPMPEPIDFTLNDTLNGENFEAKLIKIKGVYKVYGTWPKSGSDANLYINTDPAQKKGMILRIDKDTDIDGTTEPTWPKDIVGVLTQFKSSSTTGSGYQILPRALTDILSPTAVEDKNVNVTTYSLKQNYPNPFNPTTKIQFTVPKAGNVKVSVYNLMGQEVAVLFNGYASEGLHTVNFNAANMNSGIYICKMEAGNFKTMIKMALVK